MPTRRAVEKGIKRGDTRDINGYVATAPNGSGDERNVGVFVVDTNPKNFQRLISAARVVVEESDAAGTYSANLQNMRILFLGHTARGQPDQNGKQNNLQLGRKEIPTAVAAPSYARTLNIGAFAGLPPRRTRDDQLNLKELLPWFAPAGESTPKRFLRGTKIILQSFLCLIATLAALLAVCLTRSAKSMAILPLFAGGVVATDIVSQEFAKFLFATGWQPLLPRRRCTIRVDWPDRRHSISFDLGWRFSQTESLRRLKDPHVSR